MKMVIKFIQRHTRIDTHKTTDFNFDFVKVFGIHVATVKSPRKPIHSSIVIQRRKRNQ
jgi:hypothetical protein